jgi:hypothetical protein
MPLTLETLMMPAGMSASLFRISITAIGYPNSHCHEMVKGRRSQTHALNMLGHNCSRDTRELCTRSVSDRRWWPQAKRRDPAKIDPHPANSDLNRDAPA